MANWDNQHTKTVTADMAMLEDLGMVEGYAGAVAGGDDEAARQRKATEAVAKFFREFSPYQRGYIYGHLTRLYEQTGEQLD